MFLTLSKKIIVLFFVFSFLFLSNFVLVQEVEAESNIFFSGVREKCMKSGDCDFTDVIKVIANIYNFLISYIGVAILIMLIVSGFVYLTSQGNKDNIKKAQGIFIAAIIGGIIALCAWLIINTILKEFIAEKYHKSLETPLQIK